MSYLGDLGNTSDVQADDMNKGGSRKMLPDGWYRVALEEDEVHEKDWGAGLNLQLVVLTGDYEGAKHFHFLTLRHPNEQATKFARIRLRELAVAANHPRPDDVQDTGPLHGVPVMVRIYREVPKKEKDKKYADEDGKKANVGEYLSCAEWKRTKFNEPMPGYQAAKDQQQHQAAAPPLGTQQQQPPSTVGSIADADIPF